MTERTPRLLVTFATTTAALAMEQACREEGVPGRLIPVPGSIRAGCGMGWAAPAEQREAVEALVIRRRLAVDGIYELRR